jgi:hypothetical protein
MVRRNAQLQSFGEPRVAMAEASLHLRDDRKRLPVDHVQVSFG